MSRPVVLVAAVLATALTVAACGSDGNSSSSGTTAAAKTTGAAATKVDPSKQPVTLAFIADTVPGVPLVDLIGSGVYAAQKYINSELGGFGGREFKIFECDGKLDPAAETTCANRAVEAKSIGMVGLGLEWGTNGLPVFEKAGISSHNAPNSDPEMNSKVGVGLNPGGRLQFAAGGKYMCDQKAKKVAIMATGVADANTAFKPDIALMKACGINVTFVGIPPTASDFSPFAQKAVSLKPDWIVVNFGQPPTQQILKQLKAANFPTDHIMGTTGSADQAFLKKQGANAEGMFYTLEFNENPDSPDVQLYLEKMAKYSPGKPATQQFAAWGWSVTMAVYNAGKKLGFDKVDAANMLKFWHSPDAQGLNVPLGHPISKSPECCSSILQPWAKVVQWKDGKYNNVVKENDGWTQPFG